MADGHLCLAQWFLVRLACVLLVLLKCLVVRAGSAGTRGHPSHSRQAWAWSHDGGGVPRKGRELHGSKAWMPRWHKALLLGKSSHVLLAKVIHMASQIQGE